MQSPSKSVVQSKQLQNQHDESYRNPVPVEFFLMLKLGGMLKLDFPLYAKSVKKRRMVETAAESESARRELSESSTG